jgi:hypothetical protein
MRELPCFADPDNLVEPEEENIEGAEPTSALEYCQDVYRGRRAADPWRMRAAMAALPFESPKLAITTNLTGQDFAAMLDRAIAASGKVLKQIEAQPEPEQPLGREWNKN